MKWPGKKKDSRNNNSTGGIKEGNIEAYDFVIVKEEREIQVTNVQQCKSTNGSMWFFSECLAFLLLYDFN